MTIVEFNLKGFNAGDWVRVIKIDGSEETIQLERGEAYAGTPERTNYLTKEIIPGTPPSIVVQATPETPQGRGIPLEDVEDVVLL